MGQSHLSEISIKMGRMLLSLLLVGLVAVAMAKSHGKHEEDSAVEVPAPKQRHKIDLSDIDLNDLKSVFGNLIKPKLTDAAAKSGKPLLNKDGTAVDVTEKNFRDQCGCWFRIYLVGTFFTILYSTLPCSNIR